MKLTDDEIFEFVKCVEELNELSVVLIQQITKPTKNLRGKILGEVSDVLYRLWPIIEIFDEREIKEAIDKKIAKNDGKENE